MFDFSIENIDIARAWILNLFKDKKYLISAICKEDEVLWNAIVKYEEDPYAFPKLEEDQFDEVFSAFEDAKILVVHNFPCYLKRNHFVQEHTWKYFEHRSSIAFTISKEAFDYKMYLDFYNQFSEVAYIDQKSGRTLIALSELNFLIYP